MWPLARESAMRTLLGSLAAKACDPCSPTLQPSKFKALSRVARLAAARGSSSSRAPARASAPASPTGFPPRCEPRTSSDTLLLGKCRASAFAPSWPMQLRSSKSRSRLSHRDRAFAISSAPWSRMQLALRQSSRITGPALLGPRSLAMALAPWSPISHSTILMICILPAQGLTKAVAAEIPESPMASLRRTSSWQLSRRGASARVEAFPCGLVCTDGGGSSSSSTSTCEAVAMASAKASTAPGEARGGSFSVQIPWSSEGRRMQPCRSLNKAARA
mmetsp:Transcript_136625/g.237531  ORF Transcript_136625/g.237531 Transcript_136625/m.237531 type:complete len:275 (-) Transcript_136625:1179-2003(-)